MLIISLFVCFFLNILFQCCVVATNAATCYHHHNNHHHDSHCLSFYLMIQGLVCPRCLSFYLLIQS